MLRKTLVIVALSLSTIAFCASIVFADVAREDYFFKKQANRVKNVKVRAAGAETAIGNVPATGEGNQSLGYDQIVSNSPGMMIGASTYDLQSNSRNNRMVDWRGSQAVHIVWMKSTEEGYSFLDRGTAYNWWDPDDGEIVFGFDEEGGCDVHPRLGPGNNYSGYVGLDVDTEGKVVIGNHHNEGSGYASTVWYDFIDGSCFFSPYRRRMPDSLMMYGITPGDILLGDYEMIWPQTEYQVWDGDTVTHVFSMQYENKDPESSLITYFRRIGSDTLGYWEYPPMPVDTIQTVSQCVTASRVSGKVALVWQAPPGNFPGDNESLARDDLDPGLGSSQRTNDVFYRISEDMGDNWTPNENLTDFDSTQGGWLGHGDMSVLIDLNDKLHILWPAREILPTSASEEGGLGAYAHFWGARLFHWDEVNNQIRPVADANWDLPDSGCTGGAWNEMSIVKPMISECDGKFYAFFVQFNDIYHGFDNDCADCRYTGECSWNGTANGEIMMSVSDDGGFSWDLARNLTNTYTAHCFETEADGLPVCESDQYVSVSRYGMEIATGDFTDVVIVDPGEEPYTGNHYLDVTYMNDKFPGSCMQNDGIWSVNPFKWFRVPCVAPILNPVLAYSPREIDDPLWTKPGVQRDTSILLENIGNADLHIATIVAIEDNGPPGWLGVSNPGPLTLGYLSGSSTTINIYMNLGGVVTDGPHVLTGRIEISSDAVGSSVDYVDISLIVADTLQFPEEADIRTDCKRIIFNNAGNMGSGGEGEYNLDYVAFGIDCDVTDNKIGYDDRADIYLYDASPFITRINEAGDTILNYYMFNASWINDYGFRPLEGLTMDTSGGSYQYGYTGKFVTQDSLIGLEIEYFAPVHPDTCSFMVLKQRIYNNTYFRISDVVIGDAMDWDIPADSGSRNQSGYNDAPDKQLLYCYGYDYGFTDSFPNNDCVDDEGRVGGYAFYGGYRLPYCEPEDSFPSVKSQYTHINADWVYPNNGFVAEQFYPYVKSASGYSTWEATGDPTNSDSVAQDLHHVVVFGEYDLNAGDTLIFLKILTTEYDGGVTALEATVEKARAWIAGHPEIFAYPEIYEPGCDCCDVPGDVNNDGEVNILDVTYLICWLYFPGWPWCGPPPCLNEADPNGNCIINILDVTFLIAYLYKDGPDPVCGCVE